MPPTAVAKVNTTVIAESDEYEKVEGNVYFPPSKVNKEYLKPSETKTYCPWKGTASYYDLETPDGVTIKDAAWYYDDPKDKFYHCKDYVAFYKNKDDLRIITPIPE